VWLRADRRRADSLCAVARPTDVLIQAVVPRPPDKPGVVGDYVWTGLRLSGRPPTS
jgi:hypothetical protein